MKQYGQVSRNPTNRPFYLAFFTTKILHAGHQMQYVGILVNSSGYYGVTKLDVPKCSSFIKQLLNSELWTSHEIATMQSYRTKQSVLTLLTG